MPEPTLTEWAPCQQCGSMTRHDDGLCYRDTRHPRAAKRAAVGEFTHTPETPSFVERRDAAALR